MMRISVFLMILVFGGCSSMTGYGDNNADSFYESKAELEAQCSVIAQEQNPGYPARRGVLNNYRFTRDYDQCLEKKAMN